MPSPSPLEYDAYYHIYNRGINGENVFRTKRNYHFFLQRYAKYIEPVAFTYAYCLMKNHFHLLIRTKRRDEQRQRLKVTDPLGALQPSQQFSNLFNAYAKAFNRAYGRTGSLFEHPFHRIRVTTDEYFARVITYIHQNPQLHGFVDDFREWPYSSYHAMLSERPTRVRRVAALEWFGGRAGFLNSHGVTVDVDSIASIVLEKTA
jgi:REP element-mobilizing transposase RayT